MRLYKAQVCPISDESKVAKFLFPSPLQFSFPFYGCIETCCLDLLHQFMSSPYSSSAMDHSLGCCLLLLLLLLPFGCSGYGVNCVGGALYYCDYAVVRHELWHNYGQRDCAIIAINNIMFQFVQKHELNIHETNCN